MFGQAPVYVNHKQYQRILVRRLKKQLHLQKLTEAQIKAVTDVSESIGIKSEEQKVCLYWSMIIIRSISTNRDMNMRWNVKEWRMEDSQRRIQAAPKNVLN